MSFVGFFCPAFCRTENIRLFFLPVVWFRQSWMRNAYLFSSSSAIKGEEQPISTRFLSLSISFNETIKVGRNHVEKVGADTDIFITLRVLFQSLSVSILRLKE